MTLWYPYKAKNGDKFNIEVVPIVDFLKFFERKEKWTEHVLDKKSIFYQVLLLGDIFTLQIDTDKYDSLVEKQHVYVKTAE